ncbi:MAG TPA: transporter substrate-binding domain-containing protein [Spirochaetota bacterium]|nr:transporter substrate-binding domain-containing protein [Spirochaetota bacterium]
MKKNFFILFSIFQILNISPRDLIIGGKISEQSRWFDKKSQKFTGFDVEIIDYIFSELGISYEIILENSSARLEHGWKSETPFYDMVFTYSKKEERKKYLIYPFESHISIEWHFFIRKEDEGKYKFDSYKDLRGLKIGYTRGQSYTIDFMQALKNKIFIGDEVVKDELQITKLLNGSHIYSPI